jgi:hypothetical protein
MMRAETTVAEFEAALETAYHALELANQDELPAEQWSIYEGRVAACRADLHKAQRGQQIEL